MKYWIILITLVMACPGLGEAQEKRNGFRLDPVYKSNVRRKAVAPDEEERALEIFRVPSSGQMDVKRFFRDVFRGYTSIDVSPQVGYHWNEFFSGWWGC